MVEKRKGFNFAYADPDTDRKIVSILEFRGNMYLATQKGVYILKDDTFVRLEIVDNTDG